MSIDSPTQYNRPIKLTAPAPYGDKTLLLRAFHLSDALSRPFELELEIQSLDPDVAFEKLIGQYVTVAIDLPTNQKRYLRGVVLEFEQVGFDADYTNYRAVVVPWLTLLRQSVDCRVFENISVPDLAMQIFKDRGFDDYRNALTQTYPVRPFLAQYNESDFQFVSRLFEDVGIYYYFELTDTTCTLVMCDADTADREYPGYGSIPYNPQKPEQRIPEHIYEWRIKSRFEAQSAAVTGYDYENPRQVLKREKSGDDEVRGQSIESYEFEDFVLTPEASESIAQVRAEEMRSEEVRQRGVTDALGICVGYHFSLTSYPRRDQNIKYLITSTDWHVTTPPFTAQQNADLFLTKASFGALDATRTYRPKRVTPKKRIKGPQTAIVVGPEGEAVSTNPLGSVRVRFPWADPNSSSCWVRVSQPWASKDWGAMFIPHVGDEVVVSFRNGDPDLPLVTGRVYNADQKPPENPETNPDEAIIQDVGGNYLKMISTAGSEEVALYSPNNSSSIVIGPGGIKTSTTGSKHDHVETNNIENTFGYEQDFVAGLRLAVVAGLETVVNLISKVELVEAYTVSVQSTEAIEATNVGHFRTVPTALKKIGQHLKLIEEDQEVITAKTLTATDYTISAATYSLDTPKQTEAGGSSSEDWTFNKAIMATNIKLTGIALTSVSSDVTTNVKGSVAVNITGAIINIG